MFQDWKGNIKFKINLHLYYFDKGYGRLSIVKYFWLIVGGLSFQSDVSLVYTIYLGFIYMVICYILGWFWYKKGWNEAEIEVMNQVNPFVQEMRKVYKV